MVQGQCQCGKVRAVISGTPIQVRQCWCRHCQQVAAGGPTLSVIFRADDISMWGDLSQHSYTAASGNRLTQSYCGSCGTPVMAQSSARPEVAAIRLGFLDRNAGFVPQVAIWTEEAPDWATIDERLEQFPRQPPPPKQDARRV
jgi:hypothetical protein